MPCFQDRRADRTVRMEQRLLNSLQESARLGRSANSRSRSRSRCQTLSKKKERTKELENKIADLAGAVLDLENNADEWADWWGDWKSFLQRLFNRLRYLQ